MGELGWFIMSKTQTATSPLREGDPVGTTLEGEGRGEEVMMGLRKPTAVVNCAFLTGLVVNLSLTHMCYRNITKTNVRARLLVTDE